MARKGNSRHIKRLASSSYLGVGRKSSAYVMKQNPGRYTLKNSIALCTLLKEKMGAAADSREARILISSGKVSINGKAVKEMRYPVGFGDVVALVPTGESYRVGVAKKGAISVEKARTEGHRTVKVVGKFVGANGKIMLRLYDGTILSGSNEVRVNDSVELKGGAVGSVIRFSNGARCYVMKGSHASESGVITETTQGTATRDATVKIDGSGGSFRTLVENVMVVQR